MTLTCKTAIMAALLVTGGAAGPIGASADEAPSSTAPHLQAPEARPSHDREPEATTPQDTKEADPFGRAPGCPLIDDEPPSLLIG